MAVRFALVVAQPSPPPNLNFLDGFKHACPARMPCTQSTYVLASQVAQLFFFLGFIERSMLNIDWKVVLVRGTKRAHVGPVGFWTFS